MNYWFLIIIYIRKKVFQKGALLRRVVLTIELTRAKPAASKPKVKDNVL